MSRIRTRREGFMGQHLVVLPAPIRRMVAHHPLLRSLLVTDAGYYPSAEGHRVERPQGASTHLIILCVHGSGWARSHERTIRVNTGEIIWLPADTPHAYGASANDPWRIFWAHFQGDEVGAWQQELGWAANMPFGWFDFGQDRIGALGLDKIYPILEAGYSTRYLLSAATALRAVFCAVLERMSAKGASKTAEERTAAVREGIVAAPGRTYRLDELAASAGLSIAHFCLLFRRQTGFTPIDFVVRQRIREACLLLDRSKLTIAGVASEVGFIDPYYFSRCFRRVMGISPRAFRDRIKG